MPKNRFESWDEAETFINNIRADMGKSYSGVWFRGHASSDWSLETTLERRGQRNLALKEYYGLIGRVKPAVESFTNSHWDFVSPEEIGGFSNDYDSLRQRSDLPSASYLSYLRHHGFPSPLLDWTGSPYVAAYFAFSKALNNQDVTIYAFCEKPLNMKQSSSDWATIKTVGPYIASHRRHFMQQSCYTVCIQFETNTGWHFSSHQTLFDKPKPQGTDQDRIWKISIAGSERLKVLEKLDQYNLNAFSLFNTDDSLMETLATREIDQNKSQV